MRLHIRWVILWLWLIINYLTRWVSILTSRFQISWSCKRRIVLSKNSCVDFVWRMIQLTRYWWKETLCTSCNVDVLTSLYSIFDAHYRSILTCLLILHTLWNSMFKLPSRRIEILRLIWIKVLNVKILFILWFYCLFVLLSHFIT